MGGGAAERGRWEFGEKSRRAKPCPRNALRWLRTRPQSRPASRVSRICPQFRHARMVRNAKEKGATRPAVRLGGHIDWMALAGYGEVASQCCP